MRRAGRGGRSRWELGGRLNPAAGCSIDTRRHYRLYYTTIFYSVLFTYLLGCQSWCIAHFWPQGGALPKPSQSPTVIPWIQGPARKRAFS